MGTTSNLLEQGHNHSTCSGVIFKEEGWSMQQDSWVTESRQTLLDRSPWLVVEGHQVRSPSGKVIPNWTWVIVRSFINVVAVTPEGQLVLLRQAKYAAKGTSLATVGGCIEQGEDTLVTAKRELWEEAGYQADQWTSLGEYAIDANRGCGACYLYLALGAVKVSDPLEPDEPGDEVLLMDQQEARTALLRGEFRVISWANAVSMALLWLDSEKQDTP